MIDPATLTPICGRCNQEHAMDAACADSRHYHEISRGHTVNPDVRPERLPTDYDGLGDRLVEAQREVALLQNARDAWQRRANELEVVVKEMEKAVYHADPNKDAMLLFLQAAEQRGAVISIAWPK